MARVRRVVRRTLCVHAHAAAPGAERRGQGRCRLHVPGRSLMSLFTTAEVTCGACGNKHEVLRAASINADRREDLRQAILDGSFQLETCVSCGERMRLPAQVSYLDIGRGQWIIAEDTAGLETWREAEARAQGLFDSTFGRAAPPLARELGGGLAPRLVFGWPAMREKLL